MNGVRTLTALDELALARVGYERGFVLGPDLGSTAAHRYRVDARSSLVADGLVLIETTSDATGAVLSYRFLDTNRVPLSVRDLRRFRILVKVADADAPPFALLTDPVEIPEVVPQDLAELRVDALDNDLKDGVDFSVTGASQASGDDCIVFEARPDSFVVSYREGGVANVLFSSGSIAQARAVFLDEACWLGAERGRGSYLGRSQAVGTEDWTPAQVVAAYERRLLGDD
jgi:hypothetical protein